MKTIEQLKRSIADIESTLAQDDAAYLSIRTAARVEIEEVDALLVPLDVTVANLAAAHDTSHAGNAIREQRNALLARRVEAERRGDRGTGRGEEMRMLRDRLAELRAELRNAELLALTEADFAKLERLARSTLDRAAGEVDDVRNCLEHLRARRAEAMKWIDRELDAVAEHAEAVGELDALRAAAFITGKPADQKKIDPLERHVTDLDRQVTRARAATSNARAALPVLETKILEWEAKAAPAADRFKVAEARLLQVAGDRAAHTIAGLIAQLREPLLTLQAANAAAGAALTQTWTEVGLNSITADGKAVRPDWLRHHSTWTNADRRAIEAERERLLRDLGRKVTDAAEI